MPTPLNEVQGFRPVVFVNGVEVSDLHCLQVEDSTGITPARAMLKQTFGRDVTGTNSLIPKSGTNPYKYGARVVIAQKRIGEPALLPAVFCGWLLRRSDQGAQDATIWQALDDRVLLQWIAARGALVWDPIDKIVRYSPRHPLTFNPGGFWNCTGITDEDYPGKTIPVFTYTAKQALAYESPAAGYDWSTLRAGDFNPWTPRRALEYLRYFAYYANKTGGAHPSLVAGTQSFLSGSATAPFVWEYSSIENMHGFEPIVPPPPDPLDRKIMGLSVQGGSLLSAIQSVLDVAGTHSLRVDPFGGTTAPDFGRARVVFPLTGYAAQGSGELIIIQRSGSAGQSQNMPGLPNAWDFHFDEDASQLVESVFVEGAPSRGETSLDFFANDMTVLEDYADSTGDDIIPAWERAQEVAFLKCIHGTTPTGTSVDYAMRARVSGDPTTLETCDGSSGRPIIWARSREALEAARESFPWVFRAWKLNGKTNFVQEVLSVPETTGPDPKVPGGLKTPRPILPEQLQFMVRNLGGGEDVKNWMIRNLPIRIRLRARGDTDPVPYREVPRDIGVTVDGEGLIWLDGLAEAANGTEDCMFGGDLFNEDDYREGRIALRQMQVNCAFPTDYRVWAIRSQNNTDLDNTIRGAFLDAKYGGGENTWLGLARYQDEAQSFIHHFQKASEPSLSPKYYGGTGGTTELSAPLTRDVPPGSETTFAGYSATRTLARFVNPRRQASFSMIGLQTQWRPGVRIDYVWVGGPNETGRYYYLRGCIGTVVHDYLTQQTTLGGLLGEYGSAT